MTAFVTFQSSASERMIEEGSAAVSLTLFRRFIPAVIVGAVIAFSFIGRDFGVGQNVGPRHFPMKSLACTYIPSAPIVASVSPSSGPSTGGTTVTITGSFFDCATSVTFGGVAATIVSISTDGTQIVVTSPAHAAGTVDVIVTTPGGTSAATAADHFTYTPSWQACESLGGVLSMGPVSSTWGTNRLDVFVRGTDAHIWHRFFDGTWHWEDLGGPFPATLPAAVSFAVGRIDLFARGGDTALWQDTFTNGGWSGWMSRGGKLASEPAVTSTGANSLDVFVQGTDNHLWRDSFDGTNWTWSLIGGVLADAPSAAAVSSSEVDAFVRGTDLGLWQWSSATGWHQLNGKLAAKPAATSARAGAVDAFVEGTDTQLWHWSSSTGWELVGGRLATYPAAVTWGGTRLDAFVAGTDNVLWHAWSTANGVWSWESLGCMLQNAPSAVTWGINRLDVFWEGLDQALWHRAFD